MFCRQCGTSVPDDAKFCPSCGEPAVAAPSQGGEQQVAAEPAIKGTPAHAAAPVAGPQSEAAPVEMPATPAPQVAAVPAEMPAPQVAAAGGAPSPKRKRMAVVAAALAAVAVVAAAVAVVVGLGLFNPDGSPTEQSRTSVVSLVFDLPEYGDEAGTGVPVKVVGTDSDGNEVSKEVVVAAHGGEVQLDPGEYQVSVVGSPVSGEGSLYRYPDKPITVTVTEDGAKTETGDSAATFEFVMVEPDKVTDKDIQLVRDWMGEYRIEQAQVDEAADKVAEAREAELERITAELKVEAFSGFPKNFLFMSGVGGWSSGIDIATDGTFTGSWHDSDMGARGPDYPGGTLSVCEFEGCFTPTEKVSDTEYLLQLDYLRPTSEAGESIESGRLVVRYDDEPYGLGEMTETPVSGWHLYLPGQSTANFPEEIMIWLYPGGKSYRESTLSSPALVNFDLGYAWYTQK